MSLARSLLVVALAGVSCLAACELVVGITDSPPLPSSGGVPPPPGPVADSGAVPIDLPDGGVCTGCNGVCVDLLADPANCGRCGRACASGTCSAGMCVPKVLAWLDADPLGLEIANPHLVFAVGGANPGVMRITFAGDPGTPPSVPTGAITAFAQSPTLGSFFVRESPGIFRCDLVGCTAVWSVGSYDPDASLRDVAVSGNDGRAIASNKKKVYSFKAGASAGGQPIVADMLFQNLLDAPQRVAVRTINSDPVTAWISGTATSFRVTKSCGASPCEQFVTQADATLKPPGALVILPDALYFSIASKGEVYRCTTADKCSPIATGLGSPGEMIADTEYLYVSDAAKGQVVRYRLGEPAPNAELIVRDTPGVGPLVVTGNYLYIATRKAAGAAQAQILSAMKAP